MSIDRIRFSLLMALAMLAATCLGAATASAAELNMSAPDIHISGEAYSLSAVQITEKTIGSIKGGQLITITLPEGLAYLTNPVKASVAGKAAYFNIPVQVEPGPGKAPVLNGLQSGDIAVDTGSNAQTLVLKVLKRSYSANPAVINLLFSSRLTHKDPRYGSIIDGDSHVSVTAPGAGFQLVILADSDLEILDVHKLPAGTFVSALSYPKVKTGVQKLGGFRIMENIEGALRPDGTTGAGAITLTLPKGIKWEALEASPAGGFSSISRVSIDTDSAGRSRASFTLPAASVSNAGLIDITPTVAIGAQAQPGDIQLSIGGTNANITPAGLIIGRYSNAGITGTLTGQTVIYAGSADAPLGTLVLRENAPGSLIEGRVLYVELPSGCQWVSLPRAVTTRGNCTLVSNGVLSGSNGRIAAYTVAASSSGGVESEIEFRNGSVSVPVGFPPGGFSISFGGTAF
jgi:hypothetical protein